MCNEILPENFNLLLDEFERTLCLPILLGIFYFTIMLAIPLITSIYSTAQGYLQSASPKRSSCKDKSFVNKIKGMIGLSLFPNSESDSSSLYRSPSLSDSQIFDKYDCDD